MQTSHLGKTDAKSSYRHNLDTHFVGRLSLNARGRDAARVKNDYDCAEGGSETGRDHGANLKIKMTNAFTTLETLMTISLSLLVFGSFISFATVFLHRTGEAKMTLIENLQVLQAERAVRNYVGNLETSYLCNSLPILQEACEEISSGEIFKNRVIHRSDIKISDIRILYDSHGYRRGIQATYTLDGKTHTTKALLSETEVLNAKGEFAR